MTIDATPHLDDIAVDGTAELMKSRLADKRAEGYDGWHDPEQCSVEFIAQRLINSTLKGNFIDVMNFAMMLCQRGAAPGVLTDALINHCALAGSRSLEDLASELLAPRKILRDKDGHLQHPAIPALDESVCVDEFLGAFGLQTAFVDMESDDPAAMDRYLESQSTDCSYWTPSRPNGEGWQLIEIYDTEDGPCAMYARRALSSAAAPRQPHFSTLLAHITRTKRPSGELTLQLEHQVPRYMHAGQRVSVLLATQESNQSADKCEA